MRTPVAVALATLIAATTANAEPWSSFTVKTIGSQCDALQEGPITPAEMYCTGYVGGVVDGLTEAGAGSGTLFCIPDRVTLAQLGRVVSKWVKDHPEAHHRPAVVAVVASLHGAFPCPAGSKSGA